MSSSEDTTELVQNTPSDKEPIVKSEVKVPSHLDFKLLIEHDNDPAEPASGVRRMPGSFHSLEQTNLTFNDNKPQSHFSTSSQALHSSFPNTSISEDEYGRNKFNERDFSSHRTNVVHMSHPMNTHLTSNELRTIKSAYALQPSKKSKSHKSRRDKNEKLDRKTKRRKSSSTTAVSTKTPFSIPEEDENPKSLINDADGSYVVDIEMQHFNDNDDKEDVDSDKNESDCLITEETKLATFTLGEDPKPSTASVNLLESAEELIPTKKKKHHKRKHKHDIALQRRMSGNMRKRLDDPATINTADSDIELSDLHQDEIKSHRYENRIGMRKHLLQRPIHLKKQRHQILHEKSHLPHEMFVELNELKFDEWHETARWIKFEEDVEESQLWGKPHVASLSFHSLHDLRKAIEQGTMLLDVQSNCMDDISRKIVQSLQEDYKLDEDQGHQVYEILMKKHNHIPTDGNNLLRSLSTYPLISHTNTHNFPMKIGEEKVTFQSSCRNMGDLKLMKKIPENAESALVLVGNVEFLSSPIVTFVRFDESVPFDDVISLPIPARFLFLLIGPKKDDYDYHEIGRSMSTLLADKEFRVMAYQAELKGDLLNAINEFLDDSVVLAPYALENIDLLKHLIENQKDTPKREKKHLKSSDDEKIEEKESLVKRTKKPFGGLIKDVKRRYKKYKSDIFDAFNLQCFAAIIFIYFAALSPAITFGGLLSEKTNNLIGASEMLLGCSISGVLFGFFSGQPVLIVGSTGPLLVFEESIYEFSKSSGLEFLSLRVWIGFWIAVIAFVVVLLEGSFLVRYIRKFTEEIFSTLISLIFIFETFNKLNKTYQQHPLLPTYPGNDFNQTSNFTTNNTTTVQIDNQPNTALLTTILMFGTFIIAMTLRNFKDSRFLTSQVRRTVGDFSVPISIFIMVFVDYMIKETYTQKLNVPEGISPTSPNERGWLINPMGQHKKTPVSLIFLSALPAVLVFVLIFMESQITEMIVSKKERNLKKGTGFHLNILLIGILNAIMSLFGMPWICAATLRSITHTNSLTIMHKNVAPGETAKIAGIHEQRVTTIIINLLLGLSILMQPLLKEIPLAVLFGIFLYMGVTSLYGVDLVERFYMLFTPSKNYPDFSFVHVVKPWRIHIYTGIQLICLAVLWTVKSTAIKLAFPFVLLLTVPLRRFLLPKLFTERELQALD